MVQIQNFKVKKGSSAWAQVTVCLFLSSTYSSIRIRPNLSSSKRKKKKIEERKKEKEKQKKNWDVTIGIIFIYSTLSSSSVLVVLDEWFQGVTIVSELI